MQRIIFVGLLFGALSHTAFAASFDCSKAKSEMEKAICSDQKLSALDEHLGRYYAVAVEELKDGASCLKAEQRDWVKTKRNPCAANVACLTAAYMKRLGALDALQPGASTVKYIELPMVPGLVAAIPPEADMVAEKSTKPLEIKGHLLHETVDTNNMGYAVKQTNGQSVAFVLDMNIGNSASHTMVSDLIEQQASSKFVVRGWSTAQLGFDLGRCRMIYRLP